MAGGRVVRIRVDNAGIDSTIYRIPSGSGGDAAVYRRGGHASFNETVPMEWPVYGLGFVAVSRQTGEQEEGPVYSRTVGTKFYPLTDHLGSVRVVVGDIKLPVAGGYEADVLASYDYEIYGGPRPGRSLDVSAFWRYGFQGMLKQNELSGNTAATSDYTTLYRTYDARNGRWRSHDPIHQPWESTYLGLAGNPAMLTDPWGLDDLTNQYRSDFEGPRKQPVYGDTRTLWGKVWVHNGTGNGNDRESGWMVAENQDLIPFNCDPSFDWAPINEIFQWEPNTKETNEDLHLVLDVIGMLPIPGAQVADIINAALYALEGDFENAAISLVSIAPGVGDAATAAKLSIRAEKALTAERATMIANTVLAEAARQYQQKIEDEILGQNGAGPKKIGATGKVGEDWLARNIGGTPQKPMNTDLGMRFVDNFNNVKREAHESKVGYTVLSASIRAQIEKDKLLLGSGAANRVVWHFFESPETQRIGPSTNLENALRSAGIEIQIHHLRDYKVTNVYP